MRRAASGRRGRACASARLSSAAAAGRDWQIWSAIEEADPDRAFGANWGARCLELEEAEGREGAALCSTTLWMLRSVTRGWLTGVRLPHFGAWTLFPLPCVTCASLSARRSACPYFVGLRQPKAADPDCLLETRGVRDLKVNAPEDGKAVLAASKPLVSQVIEVAHREAGTETVVFSDISECVRGRFLLPRPTPSAAARYSLQCSSGNLMALGEL